MMRCSKFGIIQIQSARITYNFFDDLNFIFKIS